MVRNVMIVFAFVFCLILPFLSCHAETNPEAQSIHLTGVGNARELGGYVTEDGRTVKKRHTVSHRSAFRRNRR